MLVQSHFIASMFSPQSPCIAIPFIMRCNLTQMTLLFALENAMKWCKLGGDLMQMAAFLYVRLACNLF